MATACTLPQEAFHSRCCKASASTVFTYFFTEFVPGDLFELGVFHASELRLLFGPAVPAADFELEFSNTMLDFNINFVNDLNPGSSWPQYESGTKLVQQLQRDNITSITDDFWRNLTELFNTPELLDEWENLK